jgi:hypothetical protein
MDFSVQYPYWNVIRISSLTITTPLPENSSDPRSGVTRRHHLSAKLKPIAMTSPYPPTQKQNHS